MYHSKSCGGPVCIALLLIHSASQAQLSFNVTTVATPGEAVPVPSELVAAYGPTLNDSGKSPSWEMALSFWGPTE